MAKRRKRKQPKKSPAKKPVQRKSEADTVFARRVKLWTERVASSTDTYDERLGEIVPIWRPKKGGQR